jgi:hypothetical protein
VTARDRRARRRTIVPQIVIGGAAAHTTSEDAHRRRTVTWPKWAWYNKGRNSLTASKLNYASWDAWFTAAQGNVVQWPGGKCGGPTQFAQEIGTLHITTRVDLGQTYVLPTNEKASIEVTGTGLVPGTDKIMIIGCQAMCGVGEPVIGSMVKNGDSYYYYDNFKSLDNLGSDEIVWTGRGPKSTRGALVSAVGSTSSLLRFSPVKFPNGGTFKVCFCDTDLRPGTNCNTTADFSLEVGTVHVSGVGYLLDVPRLVNGDFQCKQMSFGGLSCGVELDGYDTTESSFYYYTKKRLIKNEAINYTYPGYQYYSYYSPSDSDSDSDSE